MPYSKINGFEMYYKETGKGKPFLFAHGLMGSIWQSEQLGEDFREALSGFMRVISYDARGHGESTHTSDQRDYHWESLGRDMWGLIAELGLKKVHIGGGSMGAGTALMCASEHPEVVESLVLALPPPFEDEMVGSRQLFGLLANIVEQLGVEKAAEMMMQLSGMQVVSEDAPEAAELMRANMLKQNPDALVVSIRGLLGGPQLDPERFSKIIAPTLIIAHTDDPIHPISSANILKEVIPNAELWVGPEPMYIAGNIGIVPKLTRDFIEGL